MASPKTSIFISHVNGDPDAEEVLEALLDEREGLKQKLGLKHAYDLAYDRKIIAGKEWRREIYAWLIDCAAAIVLVSRQAFNPEKPWVSHEATCLAVIQAHRRDLLIIPVLLQGAETLLTTQPAFKPSGLIEKQALRFPDPPHLHTCGNLVNAIAERIKQELPELPACGSKHLVGLAAELRDKISEFPEAAQRAAAAVLDFATGYVDAEVLAEQLLERIAAWFRQLGSRRGGRSCERLAG